MIATAPPTDGLYLHPGLAGSYLTPDEFDTARCDETYSYELIEGVLVVSPPVDIGERSPNDLLGHLLYAYQQTHPQGNCLDATIYENQVRGTHNRRRADRVIWVGLGHAPDVMRDLPAIAVEFVSVDKRDRHRDFVVKRAEYQAVGIREYWIIDRFRRQMTLFRFASPSSAEEIIISEADTYTTPLLPGFELPLAKLLREADRMTQNTPTTGSTDLD